MLGTPWGNAVNLVLRGSRPRIVYQESVPTFARYDPTQSARDRGVPGRSGRGKHDLGPGAGPGRPTTGERGDCHSRVHEPGRRSALDWIGPGTVASVRVDLRSLGFRTVAQEAVVAVLENRGERPSDPDRTAAKVGAVLGARWVIVGSYLRLGARLRLTARLYDPTTDEEVRVVRAEGLRADVFDLQDQIAEQLGASMRRARVAESAVPILPSTSGFRMPAAVIDGPPPPQAPAVISRDADGRATIRAVRLEAALELDGALTEAVYADVSSISDFVQMEPDGGAPATEQTEVWVLFDNDNIYISVRCWESRPEQIIANDMRRDGANVRRPTASASRSTRSTMDGTRTPSRNAIGGRMDGEITNERGYNGDWNPVWDVAVDRFVGGWSYEAAVPFKSLRYQPGREQVWGLQVGRTKVSNNELSYITPLPYGTRGLTQMSLAPTLIGLEAPSGSANLEIKPYAIPDLTTDRSAEPVIQNEWSGDAGLDVKYSITQNLTADLTVNTDFAQVEADEQQVNLTRFSLFFPEKREFFLENRGIFAFGGAGTGPGPVRGSSADTPVLFYSRQIGLSEGREVPIDVGGRLAGRLGGFSVGMLNIQTADEPATGAPATNFTVLRLKRDVLRRSSIGALFTGRSVSTRGTGSNQAYGVDGTFAFGSSHKCMHDFAPGRSATAVGRRCGCARAGTQRCSRLSLSRRPPARAPLLVGGPARRQPDQTQAADAMALTWRRTEKASGRGLDFRRRSTLEPNPSLTVQPPWNWQPRHDSAGWCGRIFREPATPPQIQTVLVGHVSH